MKTQFDDINQYEDRIVSQLKFESAVKPRPPITLVFSHEIESSGRETLYKFNSTALLGQAPFAHYSDKDNRRHSHLEDGVLDISVEMKDFMSSIGSYLSEKGYNFQSGDSGLRYEFDQ